MKKKEKLYSLAEFENVEIWDEDIFENAPAVLAYAYWNIYRQCKNRQMYGIVFSIKDAYEVLLKYNILVLCSWAKSILHPGFINQPIERRIVQQMLLGHWLSYAKELRTNLLAYNIKIPLCIINPLNNIISIYDEKHVVNWRNNYIGHGAMKDDRDPTLKLDIEEHLNSIWSWFRDNKEDMMKHRLSCVNVEIKGHDTGILSLLEENKMDILLNFQGESSESISLYPYFNIFSDMLHKTSEQMWSFGLYMYDGINRGNKKQEFLSYSTGYKNTQRIPYFQKLLDEERKMDTGNSAFAEYYSDDLSESDFKYIHDINVGNMGDDFFPPTYATSWLSSKLNFFPSGIFHLYMDRGMGKTTLASKLDKRDSRPIAEIDNTIEIRSISIGAYSCDGAQTSRKFESEMSYIWSYASEEEKRRHYQFEWKQAGSSDNFSRLISLLQKVHEYNVRVRGSQKTLLVIDGLDEIQDENMWGYVNNEKEEALPEGIYILLLSRSVDDCKGERVLSRDTMEHMGKLVTTCEHTINRYSTEYINFLREYILHSDISASLNDADIDLILAKSNNTILQVRMLARCFIYIRMNDVEMQKLLDSPTELYLNVLQKAYGDKEFHHLTQIISIILLFGNLVPLKLSDIAELSWCSGRITIDLVGKMRDIEPLLKIGRGYEYRGRQVGVVSTYSIANEDVKENLIKILNDRIAYEEKIISDEVMDNLSYFVTSQDENIINVVTAYLCVAENYLRNDKRGDFEEEKLNCIIEFIRLIIDKMEFAQNVLAISIMKSILHYSLERENSTVEKSFQILVLTLKCCDNIYDTTTQIDVLDYFVDYIEHQKEWHLIPQLKRRLNDAWIMELRLEYQDLSANGFVGPSQQRDAIVSLRKDIYSDYIKSPDVYKENYFRISWLYASALSLQCHSGEFPFDIEIKHKSLRCFGEAFDVLQKCEIDKEEKMNFLLDYCKALEKICWLPTRLYSHKIERRLGKEVLLGIYTLMESEELKSKSKRILSLKIKLQNIHLNGKNKLRNTDLLHEIREVHSELSRIENEYVISDYGQLGDLFYLLWDETNSVNEKDNEINAIRVNSFNKALHYYSILDNCNSDDNRRYSHAILLLNIKDRLLDEDECSLVNNAFTVTLGHYSWDKTTHQKLERILNTAISSKSLPTQEKEMYEKLFGVVREINEDKIKESIKKSDGSILWMTGAFAVWGIFLSLLQDYLPFIPRLVASITPVIMCWIIFFVEFINIDKDSLKDKEKSLTIHAALNPINVTPLRLCYSFIVCLVFWREVLNALSIIGFVSFENPSNIGLVALLICVIRWLLVPYPMDIISIVFAKHLNANILNSETIRRS